VSDVERGAPMERDEAERIVREFVGHDVAAEGIDEILRDIGERGVEQCIANWRAYSAEAGDVRVVIAIDLLGADAAEIYHREVIGQAQIIADLEMRELPIGDKLRS
jgi:hypothetical protein